MEGVLIFFGIIGALFLGAWHLVGYEWRQAEKREKLAQLQLELKLLEEKEKPKYFIEFVVNEMGYKRTKPIEPIILMETVVNSKDRANRVLRAFYDKGYFRDADDYTYPTCNITKAYIQEITK